MADLGQFNEDEEERRRRQEEWVRAQRELPTQDLVAPPDPQFEEVNTAEPQGLPPTIEEQQFQLYNQEPATEPMPTQADASFQESNQEPQLIQGPQAPPALTGSIAPAPPPPLDSSQGPVGNESLADFYNRQSMGLPVPSAAAPSPRVEEETKKSLWDTITNSEPMRAISRLVNGTATPEDRMAAADQMRTGPRQELGVSPYESWRGKRLSEMSAEEKAAVNRLYRDGVITREDLSYMYGGEDRSTAAGNKPTFTTTSSGVDVRVDWKNGRPVTATDMSTGQQIPLNAPEAREAIITAQPQSAAKGTGANKPEVGYITVTNAAGQEVTVAAEVYQHARGGKLQTITRYQDPDDPSKTVQTNNLHPTWRGTSIEAQTRAPGVAGETNFEQKEKPLIREQAATARTGQRQRERIMQILAENPEISNIYRAGGVMRDVIDQILEGNFKTPQALAEALSKINLTPGARANLEELRALQLKLNASTLKEVAGAGAVSDAEQAANRAANIDATRAPLATVYSRHNSDNMVASLADARERFLDANPGLRSAEFNRQWNEIRRDATALYEQITSQRAAYIQKHGYTEQAVIAAQRLYPNPTWDNKTSSFVFRSNVAPTAAAPTAAAPSASRDPFARR